MGVRTGVSIEPFRSTRPLGKAGSGPSNAGGAGVTQLCDGASFVRVYERDNLIWRS